MKRMKVKALGEIHDIVIKSNVDAKLFTYISTHQTSTSKLSKVSSTEGADIKYLAKSFEVTDRKVQKFFAEIIELGLVKKIGKEFYVNPYLIQPFKVTNNMLHQLQIWWNSTPTAEIEFISKEDIMATMLQSSQKILLKGGK